MVASPDTRAARGLSLVAALYLAFAPVSGLVVCHEPDGSANVELANADLRCTGCDERPQCGHDSPHDAACSAIDECPCVDVLLTPDRDSSNVPSEKSVKEVASAPLVAIVPSSIDPKLPRFDGRLGRREIREPRPPPGFLHLRSVVLVV